LFTWRPRAGASDRAAEARRVRRAAGRWSSGAWRRADVAGSEEGGFGEGARTERREGGGWVEACRAELASLRGDGGGEDGGGGEGARAVVRSWWCEQRGEHGGDTQPPLLLPVSVHGPRGRAGAHGGAEEEGLGIFAKWPLQVTEFLLGVRIAVPSCRRQRFHTSSRSTRQFGTRVGLRLRLCRALLYESLCSCTIRLV
jgi:hypothetical protein